MEITTEILHIPDTDVENSISDYSSESEKEEFEEYEQYKRNKDKIHKNYDHRHSLIIILAFLFTFSIFIATFFIFKFLIV